MIYRINISDQATSDLMGIYDYIFLCLKSPINAKILLDKIESGIMGLKKMPNRFKGYNTEPWKSRGLHLMPIDNFCVFYIVNNEKAEVTVMRVMYGGRNIDKHLERWTNN